MFKIKLIKKEFRPGRYENKVFINGPSYMLKTLEFIFTDYNPKDKTYSFSINKEGAIISRVSERIIENNLKSKDWLLIDEIENYEKVQTW